MHLIFTKRRKMLNPDDLYDEAEAIFKLTKSLHKLKLTKYSPQVAISALANYMVVLIQCTNSDKEYFMNMCEVTWDAQFKHKEEYGDR